MPATKRRKTRKKSVSTSEGSESEARRRKAGAGKRKQAAKRAIKRRKKAAKASQRKKAVQAAKRKTAKRKTTKRKKVAKRAAKSRHAGSAAKARKTSRAAKSPAKKRKKAAVSKRRKTAKKAGRAVKRRRPARAEDTPADRPSLVSTVTRAAAQRAEDTKTTRGTRLRAVRERGLELTDEQSRVVPSAPTTKRLAPNIYYLKTSDFSTFAEDDKPGEDLSRFTTSTSGMHASNTNFAELFRAAFYDYLKRTPFEDPDDVPIFRYGLAARSLAPRSSGQVEGLAMKLAEMMDGLLPEGASAHIVHEGKYISVKMNLGDYREPTKFTDALDYMKKNFELLDQFRTGVQEIMDDFVWFDFWDTDELYY